MHLLRQHQGVAPVPVLAAVLGRVPEPQETQVPHPLEDPVGEVAFTLPVRSVGGQFDLGEPPDVGPELLVLRREQGMQPHARSLLPGR